MTTRRAFLQGMTLCAAGAFIRPSFVKAATPADTRFVLVILRGAIDGLSVVAPVGDPAYANARGALALSKPGSQGGALGLDNFFGLHPALTALHGRYQAGELLPVHAVATPYRERSHFDGQNVLENGTPKPFGAQDGWLNRALASLPQASGSGPKGLAIGQNVPLVLRGAAHASSWAPSVLAPVDDDTMTRLMDLYSDDKILGPALAEALATDAELGAAGADTMAGAARAGLANAARLGVQVASTAGKLLAEPEGPRVGVLDVGGFDTHANEGAAQGVLAIRLSALDQALDALAKGMGEAWRKTVVLAVTEFGRTAAVNGTRGTDHGTATMALLLGGAVQGGRVLADWPGLAQSALYQGRDLKPTLDLRALEKAVLADHLGLSPAQLAQTVFPGSESIAPVRGLIRA
jgi:uncharacterized protein (DUF1501 family)